MREYVQWPFLVSCGFSEGEKRSVVYHRAGNCSWFGRVRLNIGPQPNSDLLRNMRLSTVLQLLLVLAFDLNVLSCFQRPLFRKALHTHCILRSPPHSVASTELKVIHTIYPSGFESLTHPLLFPLQARLLISLESTKANGPTRSCRWQDIGDALPITGDPRLHL